MTTNGATNKKKVLVTHTMAPEGWALLKARNDIEAISMPNHVSSEQFIALLKTHAPVHAVIIGPTRMGAAELAAAKDMRVVARVGVGFDAVDVPALSQAKVPLMVVGTANSPSVAEQAVFMMMALAKRGAELDVMVREGRWLDRMNAVPFDLFHKTLLVIGFGRIGTRTAMRALAMEMKVLVHDPYKPAADIKAAGCEPATDLDAALARADFVTIHCPKTPETVGMFNAARLARMKPTAYLVNTARGGIIDEVALHAALTGKKLAGAGLDVYAQEPPVADHPLFKLPNVISAPHMAGVTLESLDRMGQQAVRNVLSVFDGQVVRENVINGEVLG